MSTGTCGQYSLLALGLWCTACRLLCTRRRRGCVCLQHACGWRQGGALLRRPSVPKPRGMLVCMPTGSFISWGNCRGQVPLALLRLPNTAKLTGITGCIAARLRTPLRRNNSLLERRRCGTPRRRGGTKAQDKDGGVCKGGASFVGRETVVGARVDNGRGESWLRKSGGEKGYKCAHRQNQTRHRAQRREPNGQDNLRAHRSGGAANVGTSVCAGCHCTREKKEKSSESTFTSAARELAAPWKKEIVLLYVHILCRCWPYCLRTTYKKYCL